MINSLLGQDIDLAYKNHIEKFKEKFFGIYKRDKKIIIFGKEFCATPQGESYFNYLCPIFGISGICIILDPASKEIILAYNKSYIESNTSIAFHGNVSIRINIHKKFYDKCIEDFDIKDINQEYNIIQNLNISHDSLTYDTDIVMLINCLRKYKTDYELICIMNANAISIKGHKAVKEKFYNNENLNEIDLYYCYLQACQVHSNLLAYEAIIAINNTASILHYQDLDSINQKAYSLLVDAGVKYRGYSSDITYTYSRNEKWQDMINQMIFIQRSIIDNIQIGHNFYDLHIYSRKLIIEFLIKNDFIRNIDNKENFAKFIFDNEIDRIFYPHGLGHLLGLDVHDVGNNLTISDNKIIKTNSINQVRSNFRFENNIVFTIEPGCYLILDLINNANYNIKKYINYSQVQEYLKFGGIRIETNIAIYNDQIYDITKILEYK